MKIAYTLSLFAIGLGFTITAPVAAQQKTGEPRRTRIALGPQLVPSYPGSDTIAIRSLIDVSRADVGEDFKFEAPDESFGFAVIRVSNLSLGPSLGFEGERSSDDVGGLPEIDFSFELGGFAQLEIGENLRFRAEARQGGTGHDGFISVLSADYVLRDSDRQLLSFGPRVTITDTNYQNAYFGIRPGDSSSGLPAFDADGGVQSVGATLGYIQQFSPRWGIYSYAKYDRLIGDPAGSPVVAAFGSGDQFAGGIALTYTFGRGIE
ncbi:MipA/OmpV family protein [Qipengyuania sp. 902]